MNKLMIVAGTLAALNLGVVGYLLAQHPSDQPGVVAQACPNTPLAGAQTPAQGGVGPQGSSIGAASMGVAPKQAERTQAFVDMRTQEKVIRLGVQQTDCGCCNALQARLTQSGLHAQFSYFTPTNDIIPVEHLDRCRVVDIDGIPFSGYSTQEIAKIVAMKFHGDLPGPLAATRNYQGIDPREARPVPGERSLIVIQALDDIPSR